MERRNFVRNVAATGTAIMIAPSLLALENSLKADPSMAGGILPFILFEDCINIILQSPSLQPEIKDALRGDIRKQVNGNIARLANVLPDGSEKISGYLIQLAKDSGTNMMKWHNEKLSFVLGWFIFKAGIKNIAAYNQKLVRGKANIEEIRQYQDTHLIRARFGIAGSSGISGEQFSSLMLQFIGRVVTRIHTLTPDKKDGGSWVLRVSDWREQNSKIMDLYGNAIQNPDPDKVQLYVKKCNLYDPSDPLIAGKFQINDTEKENRSLYAKSVINGYNAAIGVQAFLNGKSDLKKVMSMA